MHIKFQINRIISIGASFVQRRLQKHGFEKNMFKV